MKLYLDSETCGLHSMPVLLQFAVEDGPIYLYDIWKNPVWKTLDLIEWMMTHEIIGFNLAFDMFQVVKLYTILRLLPEHWVPQWHIDEIAMLEPQGQDGPCVKPASACDLMLWSRRNEYQSLMSRKDITIRRVPTALSYALARELENRVKIDDIYFAKYKDKDAPRWRVYDVTKGNTIDPDFKDVTLKFNAAGGLKYLAEYALGRKPKYHFEDVELDSHHYPVEFGYAPTALAVSTPELDWAYWVQEDGKKPRIKGYAWPRKIKSHIEHWATNEPAREYAKDDIVYTRDLYKHFGSPEPGDDDSILACMVPAIRWHGYKIDIEGIKELRAVAQAVVDNRPINTNKPSEIREYLTEMMDDVESLELEETTEKARLVSISNWYIEEEEPCTKCFGAGCTRCDSGVLRRGNHPATARAKEVLDIKFKAKEIELYDKLLKAGKFHASFIVIGAKSSRMAGGDGLNAQGIKKSKEVRSKFPFAWDGMQFSLGDFSAFEVTLADAVYNDPELRTALMNGKKIHALFGMELFPGQSYEQILESEGSSVLDCYTKAKSGVFAMIYGGTADTLTKNLSIPPEVAKRAFDSWGRTFPGVAKARIKIFDMFCSMRQPDGIGTKVEWHEPADYIESFLGDRRYFTLENRICRALYDLAQSPPKEWKDSAIKVVRRDRVQTASGAVASALYGAAFGLQQANMRAAANHEIQSPGARITKAAQAKIWTLQPAGIHEWVVAPCNIHDEIPVVHQPEVADAVVDVLREAVESFRPQVPLIGMDWIKGAASWAGKKGDSVGESISIKAVA